MSILLVDEGNTAAKFVIASDAGNSLQKVELTDIDKSSINKIIFASVKAPEQSIIQVLATEFSCSITQVATQSQAFELTNAYKDYSRLGVDRWLAMLGALNLSTGACIVIDAGTAITIDVVDKSAQHLGGWILPSSTFSAQALAGRTGKIKLDMITEVNTQLGNSTETCVYNALYASQLALIEKLINQLCGQLNCQATELNVFVTGGDAKIYAELLASNPANIIVEPYLVFHGLKRFIHTQAT
ncbi:type III pantothenate kinase [Catenovulum sp. SX2]|uniref:type III pantothenate kinase n=1 Tax=Catenovulum sp. SX2 TaxID=3398614 RepID=UPI003F84581C